jgi:hypothetical protein
MGQSELDGEGNKGNICTVRISGPSAEAVGQARREVEELVEQGLKYIK